MTERRSLGSYALLALVAGLALGLFSGLGDWAPADTVLHVVVALANAAGPWLVTAFVVGALAGAPLAGAITASAALVAALAVYYLTIYAIGYSVADLPRFAAVWLAVSVVVGPLLGAAGGAWARPRRPFDRIGAVALLAGTLAAEAILRLIQVEVWTGTRPGADRHPGRPDRACRGGGASGRAPLTRRAAAWLPGVPPSPPPGPRPDRQWRWPAFTGPSLG